MSILASLPYDFDDVAYKSQEAITAWLSTSASQIFFMQLGFLCYEAGYVKDIWAPSIILKNIEDTFVGILTYLCFTHTFVTSSPSAGGIISTPNEVFLLGVDASLYEEVFIGAIFAATCPTIISGGVLERMNSTSYMFYCFLTVLVNYSFVAHWIWNGEGWLAKLGFMDGAGAVVVHSTGAVAAWIAIWRLGPRKGSLNRDGSLKEADGAHRPIINAIGAFILWYGWYAFNVASPVAADLQAGEAVGTTALVTCVGPTWASVSALLMMHWGLATMSYDNLLGAMIAGLVSITGCCFTVSIYSASLIGFLCSPVYFGAQYFLRNRLRIDDPLQVIAIHGICGVYSCIMEGIFANDVNGHVGLIHGGYGHFLIQILGSLTVFGFNAICSFVLWYFIMERVAFRNTNIRQSPLHTFLRTTFFEKDNSLALQEVIENGTNLAKQMSLEFHVYSIASFDNEQFDFLLAVQTFRESMAQETKTTVIAQAIVGIIDTYIEPDGVSFVNVHGIQRTRLLKMKQQFVAELGKAEQEEEQLSSPVAVAVDKNSRSAVAKRVSALSNRDLVSYKMFDNVYAEVFSIVLPVFSEFLRTFDPKTAVNASQSVRIPFDMQPNWTLQWDDGLTKASESETDIDEDHGRNDGALEVEDANATASTDGIAK
eukprot:CAMPEP_0202696020 /NCGR_PEP_ID=MMETSP1385-20130828/9411_1 /ASSEMBLY_ACC=CAM_ASM_000861 /TAXON_ID=933848 /ORGANISM="Elphidium margaritaceum" /LENGTH=653 /DNA_ID=CAMNT_0049352115 /DNA_START=85 /DNA_END=2046 /DNA_ORIENTATION=+